MSKATYPLKLPRSIKDAAARLAKDDGVSLNQWIASAVAEKVGSVQTAESFLASRRGSATGDRLAHYLELVPDAPPVPEDAIASRHRKHA
jgi:hypothetical protein